MGNIDLGTLIVGAICSIGMIQLITWIVVVIKYPGCDYLRPDVVQGASSQSSVDDRFQTRHSSDGGK
jgi:hypothetical protein